MKSLFAFLVLSFGIAGQFSILAQTPHAPRIEWQQTVGGASYDAPSKFVETLDGGFVFGGFSLSGISGNKTSPSWDTNASYGGDFWVVKLAAQGNTLWDRSFGGSDQDNLQSLRITTDGGFVLAGDSWQSIGGNKDAESFGYGDFWLLRLDSFGNRLWDRSFGGSRSELFWSLAETGDQGFLCVGNSDSRPDAGGNKTSPFFGGEVFQGDGWAVLVDGNGNKLWDRSFGGWYSEQLRASFRTSDGGFLLAGKSNSTGGGNKTGAHYGFDDFWVVKIDSAGEKMWERNYGGSGLDLLYQAAATPDGGFLLAGDSTSYADGNKISPPLGPFDPDAWPFAGADVWIVRIDSEGRKLWDRSVGGASADGLNGIYATKDGGAIVTGRSTVDWYWGWWGPLEYFAVRLDPAGNELWRHSFGTNTSLSKVLEMPDGGFILGGSSSSDTNQFKSSPSFGFGDCWLVRLDSSGKILWDLSLGGGGEDYLSTIAQTKDGGFILGIASASGADGNKTTTSYGDYDLWAVKLSPELPDSDGDGVSDDVDQCPNSPAGAVVNASGCSIDQIAPCNRPWKNHGEYVSAVVQASAQFRTAGLISHQQRMTIFSQAVKSDCGNHLAEMATRPLNRGRR